MLEKSKLNSVEFLISKALINSVVSHDEFVLINNFLKEYNEMKEEIKKFKDLIHPSNLACIVWVGKVTGRKVFDLMQTFIEDFSLFLKQYYHIV